MTDLSIPAADAARPAASLAQVGIGWRQPHYAALVAARPPLGFIEVHSENFFADGGAALAVLQQGRAHWPVSLHGVGLGLGSAAGLDDWHLDRLARLVQRIDPVRVSDHAAFARAPRAPGQPVVHGSDLLPLAFTDAALDILVANVQRVQDRLRRPILVENLSAYLHWADDSLAEAEFFNALTQRSGCGLLLDVNNLVVNALNAGVEPVAATAAFIDAIRPGSVGEIHLAGYCQQPDLVIDDHGSRVHPPVWQAFAHAIGRLGPRPTLIEWDTDLPTLDVLLAEAAQAAAVMAQVAGTLSVAAMPPPQRLGHCNPTVHTAHALEAQRQQLLLGSLLGSMHADPGVSADASPAVLPPGQSDMPSAITTPAAPGMVTAPAMLITQSTPNAPAPVPSRAAAPTHLTAWLRGTPAASRRGLLAYRANGLAAAERALAVAYPTLACMVGDQALAGLARELWRRQPPERGDLACWGAGLADLISTQDWLADWPWLPDIARLDWAVHQCEAAADRPDRLATGASPGFQPPPDDPLNLQALAADNAADHVLLLRPGTALVPSRWPLAALWQAHRLPAGQQAEAAHAALDSGIAGPALVCRSNAGGQHDSAGWRAIVSPLAAADGPFVTAVLQGLSLGQALAAAGDDFAFEPWLLQALRQGWISRLLPPQPTTSGVCR